MNVGLPQKASSFFPGGHWLLRTKWEILTLLLALRRRLPSFKSLSTMPRWWQCCRAETSWRNGPRASASVFCLQVGEQVSPAEVLHWYKQSLLNINRSSSFTVFGWLNILMLLTSQNSSWRLERLSFVLSFVFCHLCCRPQWCPGCLGRHR